MSFRKFVTEISMEDLEIRIRPPFQGYSQRVGKVVPG